MSFEDEVKRLTWVRRLATTMIFLGAAGLNVVAVYWAYSIPWSIAAAFMAALTLGLGLSLRRRFPVIRTYHEA
jgi:hypothetical protein